MSDNSHGYQHDHATMHATADTEISNAVTESMESEPKEKFFDIQMLKPDRHSIHIVKQFGDIKTGNGGRMNMNFLPTSSPPIGYPEYAERFNSDLGLTTDKLENGVLQGEGNRKVMPIGDLKSDSSTTASNVNVSNVSADTPNKVMMRREDDGEALDRTRSETPTASNVNGLTADKVENDEFQGEENGKDMAFDSLKPEQHTPPSNANDSCVSADTSNKVPMPREENGIDLISARSETPTASNFNDLGLMADKLENGVLQEEENLEEMPIDDLKLDLPITPSNDNDLGLTADKLENGMLQVEENHKEMPIDDLKSESPITHSKVNDSSLTADTLNKVLMPRKEDSEALESLRSETPTASNVNDLGLTADKLENDVMQGEENDEDMTFDDLEPESPTTSSNVNDSCVSADTSNKVPMPREENGEVLESARSKTPTESNFNDLGLMADKLENGLLQEEQNLEEMPIDDLKSDLPITPSNDNVDILGNDVLEKEENGEEMSIDYMKSETPRKHPNVNDSNVSADTANNVSMHGEENGQENGEVLDSPSTKPKTSNFNDSGLTTDKLENGVLQREENGEDMQSYDLKSELHIAPSNLNDSIVSAETPNKVVMPGEANGEVLGSPWSESPTASNFNDLSVTTELTGTVLDGEDNDKELSTESPTATGNVNGLRLKDDNATNVLMNRERSGEELPKDSPRVEMPTTSNFNDFTTVGLHGKTNEKKSQLTARDQTRLQHFYDSSLPADTLTNAVSHGKDNGKEFPSDTSSSKTPTASWLNDPSLPADTLTNAVSHGKDNDKELPADTLSSDTPTSSWFNGSAADNLTNGVLHVDENVEESPLNNARSGSPRTENYDVLHREKNSTKLPTDSPRSESPTTPSFSDASLTADKLPVLDMHKSDNGNGLLTYSLRPKTPKKRNIRGFKRRMLVKENENLRRQIMCIFCQARQHNILFVPCHHYILCENCSGQVTYCPLCKKTILTKVKTSD